MLKKCLLHLDFTYYLPHNRVSKLECEGCKFKSSRLTPKSSSQQTLRKNNPVKPLPCVTHTRLFITNPSIIIMGPHKFQLYGVVYTKPNGIHHCMKCTNLMGFLLFSGDFFTCFFVHLVKLGLIQLNKDAYVGAHMRLLVTHLSP